MNKLQKVKKYKQGGIIYDIVWEKVEETDLGRKHYRGHIDYNDCTIAFSYPQQQQQQVATIIHEIFHAIRNHYSLDNGVLEAADEEIVDHYTEGLLASLMDNKALWKAMLEVL